MLNDNFAGTMSNIVYYCRSKQMSARVDPGDDDDDDDAGEGREAFVLGASIRSQDSTLLPAGEETISGRQFYLKQLCSLVYYQTLN